MRAGRAELMTAAALAGVVVAASGCASRKWQAPRTYTDSASQAAEHARRLAEAERSALRTTERAIAADDKGNHDEAVRLCLEAINTYPDLGVAWHTLGVALLAKQERQRAWEAFSRAAQLSPTSPEPLYNMGVILQQNLFLRDAKRYHVEALDRDPSYLPSLREAIRIDREMAQVNEDTLERIKRALMLERDEEWREYFQRTHLRAEADKGRNGRG